ncbi:MAG TPA: hypothetical protein VIF15_15870 [Polyangiaceae bacterium]
MPSSRPRALELELARHALDTYAASAPRTRRFVDARAAIESWLAERTR